MSESSRTILEYNPGPTKLHYPFKLDKNDSIFDTSYSIIANRLVAYGGCESNRITAQNIDNHIIIINTSTVKNFTIEEILAVEDSKNIEEAVFKMYNGAKKVALKRAQFDNNKVLDLTPFAKKIPEEALYFAKTEYLEQMRLRNPTKYSSKHVIM